MTWRDIYDIAEALNEKFPEMNPLAVRFTDLRHWIMDLEDFDDDPKGSNEGILEAIQMAWYDEYESR